MRIERKNNTFPVQAISTEVLDTILVMTFTTIYLEIEKEDAHDIIMESVDGLRSKSVNGSIEYRNAAEMLLAILSDANETNRANTKLQYQISVISSFLAHDRVKTSEIKRAVEDYRVTQ